MGCRRRLLRSCWCIHEHVLWVQVHFCGAHHDLSCWQQSCFPFVVVLQHLSQAQRYTQTRDLTDKGMMSVGEQGGCALRLGMNMSGRVIAHRKIHKFSSNQKKTFHPNLNFYCCCTKATNLLILQNKQTNKPNDLFHFNIFPCLFSKSGHTGIFYWFASEMLQNRGFR